MKKTPLRRRSKPLGPFAAFHEASGPVMFTKINDLQDEQRPGEIGLLPAMRRIANLERIKRRKYLKGKPLRKTGARSKRAASALREFREAVLLRCAGRCELCGMKTPRIECHHLISRARAPGWPQLHDPDLNGMGLDAGCHFKVTMEPKAAGPRYLAAWAAWRDWMLSPQWLGPDGKMTPK